MRRAPEGARPAMAYDPMDAPRRKHRRQQRLGPDPFCVQCGERNPDALLRVPRSLLERHHVFGAAHGPGETITVCLNCHARLSAAQQDDGVPLTPLGTILERGAAVMAGAGSSLGVIGDALLEWADRIQGMVRGLDEDYREWRKRPWSRP